MRIVLDVEMEHIPGEKPHERRWREDQFRGKMADYAELLKEDFEGDWNPIVRLLVFKLRRNRDAILRGFSADKKKTARQMDAVISLLDRVSREDYHEAAFGEFYAKYGRPKMVSGPKQKDSKGNVVYGLEFVYSNGKPATPEMNKEQRRLYRKEERLLQNDLNKAFRLMAKYIRYWWD